MLAATGVSGSAFDRMINRDGMALTFGDREPPFAIVTARAIPCSQGVSSTWPQRRGPAAARGRCPPAE
jgi:hypothetical protein